MWIQAVPERIVTARRFSLFFRVLLMRLLLVLYCSNLLATVVLFLILLLLSDPSECFGFFRSATACTFPLSRHVFLLFYPICLLFISFACLLSLIITFLWVFYILSPFLSISHLTSPFFCTFPVIFCTFSHLWFDGFHFIGSFVGIFSYSIRRPENNYISSSFLKFLRSFSHLFSTF